MHMEYSAELLKGKYRFRLGITGLPGAGKTSLAYRLAPNISTATAQGIALIQGDCVLPNNIFPICKTLDRFVVEHICLAQICARSQDAILDAMVFLDISPKECMSRCEQRKNHEVGVESFEELYSEICSNMAQLTTNQNLLSRSIDKAQQAHILEYSLIGVELMQFMFPNTYLVEAYSYG